MSEALPILRIIVTGGAGFIGSHLVKMFLDAGHSVLTIDSLTYAGSLSSLAGYMEHPQHEFQKIDICEEAKIADAISSFRPDWIFHLAAETHVDRSIADPSRFFQTNVLGTVSMLRAATHYWEHLPDDRRSDFRFIHASTDEVFGSAQAGESFDESSPYNPGSPYSASKAASDHAVRSWGNTYGLPVIVTNCSNNYGPFQFPEKMIPVIITSALQGTPVPVYGEGLQIRDWLHVKDHCEALAKIANAGKVGETYVIAANDEWRNIDLVHEIARIIEDLTKIQPNIQFVTDRKGHDFRYSLTAKKIRTELGWSPTHSCSQGFQETVEWYLNNRDWWKTVNA